MCRRQPRCCFAQAPPSGTSMCGDRAPEAAGADEKLHQPRRQPVAWWQKRFCRQ